ncbi:ABC transporter [Streptococcus gallolyticus]|uniref:ABC transporter n=1 Tax=Streptococcus gallolyticus TaxID=315405 RepID=A0A368UAL5_9STRE|nr:ABC transporter ATP-binding protein [Streptococcus gallolyticus]RCW15954.1 ABC transporter [Streptococcus gallolyticus]
MTLLLSKISKSYGSKTVLNQVSAQFSLGLYGLLGANGTGKTTLLNLISHFTLPDEGQIFLDGQVQSPDFYQHIGFLPQHFSYYDNFTGLDFLCYMAALKGMSKKNAQKEADHWLWIVGLQDVRHKRIATYSGGMKQRLGIAQALLNDPKILILDEPTVGLDPKERVKFRNIISDLSARKTILLSTHIVSDVEAIAKEIIILKDGQFLHQGSSEDLLESMNGKVWEFPVPDGSHLSSGEGYAVVNEKVTTSGRVFRVVSDVQPNQQAQSVQPSLEDLYIYHFREE